MLKFTLEVCNSEHGQIRRRACRQKGLPREKCDPEYAKYWLAVGQVCGVGVPLPVRLDAAKESK